MKIGWLVWRWDDSESPEFFEDGKEPDWGFKRVRIVYAVVEE